MYNFLSLDLTVFTVLATISVFKKCCIQPVGFSDYSLVSCAVFAYWPFNTALLNYQAFKTTLKCFWESHRESRPAFSIIQQWWDFSKAQINVRVSLAMSQEMLPEVEELQSLAESSGNRGHLDALKKKKGGHGQHARCVSTGRSGQVKVVERDSD